MKRIQGYALVVVLLGALIAIDGIGSILIQSGQYHGLWFDLERAFRTLAGLLLVGTGIEAYRVS